MASADEAGGHPSGSRRARLLVAAGLGVEGLALVVLAASVVVVDLRGQAADRIGALVLGLTALALAAGILAVGAGVARAQRWARSPAVVWQLIQLAVAVPALGSMPAVAVPAAVLAVGVGIGVLLDPVLPRTG